MPFTSLGLLPELTRALADRNYVEPTPVQARVIPEVSGGPRRARRRTDRHCKTAGFTLPILQRLHAAGRQSQTPRALILVPTRELAAQVTDSIKSYGKYLRLRTVVIIGGVSIRPQIDALRQGADIVVATPGRLLDHAQERTIDLSKVEVPGAGRGRSHARHGLHRRHSPRHQAAAAPAQNLLFSATYNEDIRGSRRACCTTRSKSRWPAAMPPSSWSSSRCSASPRATSARCSRT